MSSELGCHSFQNCTLNRLRNVLYPQKNSEVQKSGILSKLGNGMGSEVDGCSFCVQAFSSSLSLIALMLQAAWVQDCLGTLKLILPFPHPRFHVFSCQQLQILSTANLVLLTQCFAHSLAFLFFFFLATVWLQLFLLGILSLLFPCPFCSFP